MSPRILRNMKFVVVASLAFVLAGCAGDLNPVRDVFVATGIGDAPGARPAFVDETRPDRLQYVPVGTAAAERETPPKTPAEILAMEEELRQLQAANETSASHARSLALSPPPAPVVVEPIPPLSEAPKPVVQPIRN
jgi:hypothetical protein